MRSDIGATGNPMFKLKGPGMKAETKQYSVNFPLEHALKDMKFARQLGDAHDVDMPMSAAATGRRIHFLRVAAAIRVY